MRDSQRVRRKDSPKMDWLSSVVLLIISLNLITQCRCSQSANRRLSNTNTQTTDSNGQSKSKNVTNVQERLTMYSSSISISDSPNTISNEMENNLVEDPSTITTPKYQFLWPMSSLNNHATVYEPNESPISTDPSESSHVETGDSLIPSTQLILRQNALMRFLDKIRTLLKYFGSLFISNG